MATPDTRTVRAARVTRVTGSARRPDLDHTAVEEPLEVRVGGAPFAVVMRTPGDDPALAAGFLLAEGVVTSPGQIRRIDHDAETDDPARRNVVDVMLDGVDVSARLAERRQVAMNAACGLCGRSTIDSLEMHGRAVDPAWTIDADVVRAMPGGLRARQDGFGISGGLHAAGLFDRDGRLDGFAEDIGRHNAVDKIVGHRLLEASFPVADRMLFVSGRTSFEIVQKAWLAGIPCVGAVSAPSSLAVQLAEEAGITLIGFVRGDRFNIYAHPDRVRAA